MGLLNSNRPLNRVWPKNNSAPPLSRNHSRTELADDRFNVASVRPSMGSDGDACRNAMYESFFAILEYKLLDRRRSACQAEARDLLQLPSRLMFRLHFALGYWTQTADEVEMTMADLET